MVAKDTNEKPWLDDDKFIEEFDKEMLSGSDRAIVLITGARIDELLLRFLKISLPFKPKGIFEGGNAVLGTWSARSKIVRALGLNF